MLAVTRGANTSTSGDPVRFAVTGGHPNPTARAFTVRLDLPAAASVRVEVFDALGRQVASSDARLSAGPAQDVAVDLANLGAGAYTYRLTADLPGGPEVGTGRVTVVR